MACVNYRWPVAECLHEHTHGPHELRDGWGQLIRTRPEKCYDCGAKRTEDGWK